MRLPFGCFLVFFALLTDVALGWKRVVFYHLEKAGGTTALALLHSAVREGLMPSVEVVNEHSFFEPRHLSADYFRIGVVREPCSYLLSEYNWGEAKKGWLLYDLKSQNASRLYGTTGDNSFSHSLFAEWVSYMNAVVDDTATSLLRKTLPAKVDPYEETPLLEEEEDKEEEFSPRCGVESMRYWTQVLNPEAGKAINRRFAPASGLSDKGYPCTREVGGKNETNPALCPCPLGTCGREATADDHATCVREILTKRPNFDCWLRTEAVYDDFLHCVEKYQKNNTEDGDQRDDAPSSQDTTRTTTTTRRRLNATAIADLIPNVRRNARRHVECAAAFADDPALVELVERQEAAFAAVFGWKTSPDDTSWCCRPQPLDPRPLV